MTASAEYQMYDDGVNTVALSGWIDLAGVHTQSKTELVDHASRFRIKLERQISPELKTFAITEVGVNLIGQTSIQFKGGEIGETIHTERNDAFSLRLGYIGLAHDTYGTFSLGKQWGVYTDIAGNTDLASAWSATASGVFTFNGDGGLNGTGRADKAIQYRNSFGNFSFGLQMQASQTSYEFQDEENTSQLKAFKEISYDHTYGISTVYQLNDKIWFGIAHNQGEFVGTLHNGQTLSAKDQIIGIGANYGDLYEQGLFLAVTANQSENHDVDNLGRIITKSNGFEMVASYTFENNFTPMLTVNYLKADDSYQELHQAGEFKRAFAVLGGHYKLDADTKLYVEARKDFSSMNEDQLKFEDDGIAIGIHMDF